MQTVRSGARSRWLLFRGPEVTAVRSESIFWNGLMGGILPLGAFVAAIVAGLGVAPMAFDPDAPLWALERPLTARERGAGVARVSGVMAAGGGQLPPLCRVKQTFGKGKNQTTGWLGSVATGAVVRAVDGTEYNVDVRVARWEPEALREVKDPSREAHWRGRIKTMGVGGWLSEQCIAGGKPVFLDGCVRSGGSVDGRSTIGSCGAHPLVVTAGDGTAKPRLEEIASWAVARITALVAALMAAALYLWHVVRGGDVVQVLARWTDPSAAVGGKRTTWRVGLGLMLLWLAVLVAHLVASWGRLPGYPVGSRAGYLAALAVVCLGTLLLVRLGLRQTKLRAAMALVLDAETARLRSAPRGALVELAVRVADSAPIVRGPLTGNAHAWCALSVTRVYRSGKNHAAAPAEESAEPVRIPVFDESGEGQLDLRSVAFDVRAVRDVVRQGAGASHPARALLGRVGAMPYTSCEVEERFIDAGETLYVLGQVQERDASPTGAGYRSVDGVPVIGGSPHRPLIVYAGDERSLLQRLARERRALDLAVGAFALLGIALVGVMCVAAFGW